MTPQTDVRIPHQAAPGPDPQALAELQRKIAEQLGHRCGECLVEAHLQRLLELLDGYEMTAEIEELIRRFRLETANQEVLAEHVARVTAAARIDEPEVDETVLDDTVRYRTVHENAVLEEPILEESLDDEPVIEGETAVEHSELDNELNDNLIMENIEPSTPFAWQPPPLDLDFEVEFLELDTYREESGLQPIDFDELVLVDERPVNAEDRPALLAQFDRDMDMGYDAMTAVADARKEAALHAEILGWQELADELLALDQIVETKAAVAVGAAPEQMKGAVLESHTISPSGLGAGTDVPAPARPVIGLRLDEDLRRQYSARLQPIAVAALTTVADTRPREAVRRMKFLAAELQRQRLVQVRLTEDDREQLRRRGLQPLVNITNPKEPMPLFRPANRIGRAAEPEWVLKPEASTPVAPPRTRNRSVHQEDAPRVTEKSTAKESEAVWEEPVDLCKGCGGGRGCCPADNFDDVMAEMNAKGYDFGSVDMGINLQR